MKNLLYLLALPFLIFSCNSNSEKEALKNVTPVDLGFYETYSVQELTPLLENINGWIAENDSILKLHQLKPIDLKYVLQYGNRGIIGCIVPGQESNLVGILQLKEVKELLPEYLEFVYSMKKMKSALNTPCYELYAIKIPQKGVAKLTGKHIKEATTAIDSYNNQPVINLEMTNDGQVLWYEMTSANINKSIAILVNNTVLSCPNVINAIDGGPTQISGNFTMDEAKDLAAGINAGRK